MTLITEITLSNRDDLRHLFTIKNPVLATMFERIFISKGEQILTPLLDATMEEKAVPDMVSNIIASMHSPAQSAVTTLLKSVGPGDNRRIALLQVLGILKDPASAPVLYDALKDPDHDIRMVAIKELGKFGREALGPLTNAMEDPDPEVLQPPWNHWRYRSSCSRPVNHCIKDQDGHRAAALKGISKISEPRQFMLVRHDKDRKVRSAVAKLLEDTGWVPKYTTDRLSYLFAKEQFEDLIKIGPPSVDILARGLHDEDSGIRAKSREALAIISDSIQT